MDQCELILSVMKMLYYGSFVLRDFRHYRLQPEKQN